MPNAARIDDKHVCPLVSGTVPHVGGPIITGSFNVTTVFSPQAKVLDLAICAGAPGMIIKGSTTVRVNFQMAARIGDQTVHGGFIVTGASTVQIGG